MKWVGTRKGLIIFTMKRKVDGMKIGYMREKIEALMQYRSALDESERELFDMLIGYADEVALSVASC